MRKFRQNLNRLSESIDRVDKLHDRIDKKIDTLEQTLNHKGKPSRRETILSGLGALGGVGALTAGGVEVYKTFIHEKRAHTKIDDIVVYSSKKTRDGNIVPGGVQLRLSNTQGELPTELVRGIITYEDYAYLGRCVSEGAVEPGMCYKVRLAVDPTPGEQQEFPLCHEVPSNGSALIKIIFSPPEDAAEEDRESGIHAYRIKLSLVDSEGVVYSPSSSRVAIFTPRDKLGLQLFPKHDQLKLVEPLTSGDTARRDQALACFSTNSQAFFRIVGVTDGIEVAKSQRITKSIDIIQNDNRDGAE